MKTVRVFFEKSGRTIYISHLDLTRAMSRALARSGLPVWYTEGFHPHLYLTFALPLSLGVTGLRETMDIRLIDDDFPADRVAPALAAALPEGLRALSAAAPVMEPADIMWADYELTLRCAPIEGREAVEALLARSEIPMEKRSKKGLKTVDIRPMFSLLSLAELPRGLTLALRCRAGVEVNLNPALVLDALRECCGFSADHSRTVRQTARNAALEEFC